MNTDPSQTLHERARRAIPGGVNSPVRAWRSVGGEPVHIVSGNGSRIVATDGVEYIDFCGSWGPLILGHAHPIVVDAIIDQARRGTSFGAPTPLEIELAELLCAQIPSMDMVRLVSSGTEAAMTAVRLARGYTGRERILKFSGCYHGHSDSMLVAAGSGLLTAGIASSAGITKDTVGNTLVAPYNDLDSARILVERSSDRLAAIIVEPIAGNMGLVLPVADFLPGLRRLADACGALLIFDEVITGFRLAPTSYGAICGVLPDLTCLGKIIGGGLPIGAVGGRRQVMERLAPVGDVYQAGTLSGNPIAVAAGLTTLRTLIRDNPYADIAKQGAELQRRIAASPGATQGVFHCAVLGGMFTIFFAPGPIRNLADTRTCDTRTYAAFFHYMLRQGFYLPPSQYEVCFISTMHTAEELRAFAAAAATFPCDDPLV